MIVWSCTPLSWSWSCVVFVTLCMYMYCRGTVVHVVHSPCSGNPRASYTTGIIMTLSNSTVMYILSYLHVLHLLGSFLTCMNCICLTTQKGNSLLRRDCPLAHEQGNIIVDVYMFLLMYTVLHSLIHRHTCMYMDMLAYMQLYIHTYMFA